MNRSRSRRPGESNPSSKTASACVCPVGERALDHVCFAIGRAYYAYLSVLDAVLREVGLEEHVRPGTGHVLFALFEHDRRTIKELVENTGLSYSTVSGLVSKLRRAKVVACERDPLDGRAVQVQLTGLGKSLESKCQAALARVDEIMLAGLSENQLRVTQNALKKMTDAMREHESVEHGERK